MRTIPILLLALAATPAPAAVTFSWQHDSHTENGDVIPPGDIAFQLEYSVAGGPLAYVDVPKGALDSSGASVSHEETDLMVMCGQKVVSRVRAIWEGQNSEWSAQAQQRQTSCPPSAPTDMTVTL